MYTSLSRPVFITMLLFSASIWAAKPAPYIGLSYGMSKPLGQYAAKDIKKGTFANRGSVLVLDFGKYYSEWGWTGTVSSASHPMDRSAFQNQLNKDGIIGHPNDSSKWMVSNMMVGAAYGNTFGRFTIELRLMGGIMFAKSPSMTVKDETQLNPDHRKFYNYQWDCVGALGSQIGISLRYQLSKKWEARLNSAFYQSTITYKSVQAAISEKNQEAKAYHYTLPVKVFDLSAGINYRFTSH